MERKFHANFTLGNSWESSRGRKFQGTKVPGDESSRGRKFQGTKVPGNESSTYGTFVPGNESSRVRKFHESLGEPDVPVLILTLSLALVVTLSVEISFVDVPDVERRGIIYNLSYAVAVGQIM